MQNDTRLNSNAEKFRSDVSQKLIDAVGVQAAIRYCRSQHLYGLIDPINKIAKKHKNV